ncbi:MAG TPA: divalent-cation tolerance protein CutA [Arenimonas sp.]|uniref:divalent-cation tolerance protein CutA n=1 Tax=Arenimonas sp. TaxID=1872635 RepID=UPI002CFF131F|nr:divalent-cation tolerance protein CutA [Arenimonas sp.]HMB55781.1 divalent-cation tolerance protein CutA [Arenimonas sp.]
MPALLVTCPCPDDASAKALAASVVADRLAACVQLLPGVASVYRWQGAIEHGMETVLLIKTWDDRLAALSETLRSRHPYQLPEIIALPIVGGSAAALAWIHEQTRVVDANETPSP